MKKMSLFIALMMCLSAVLTAQNSYQFQMFTENYSEIPNGVSLTGGESWDDLDVALPLGFSFQLFGQPINQLYGLGMGSEIYYEDDYEDDDFIMITPFYSDLIDPCYDGDYDWKNAETYRSCSDISYTVDGNPGHRIFKMQWSNAGFWGVDYEDDLTDNYINMQVWLYEENYAVEFRYGPSVVSEQFIQEWIQEEGMNFLSVLTYQGYAGEFFASVNGDPANPTFWAGSIDTLSEEVAMGFGLTSFPAANTVYRFTPQGTDGVHSYNPLDVVITPNPVVNLLNIAGADNALVQVFDVNGKQILSEVYNKPIPVSELPSGLYMVKITTDQGSVVKKIVK